MNAIKTLVAALATVAASASFAQEATPDTWITQAKSVASRQAVAAEAREALAAGRVGSGEAYGFDFSSSQPSTLARRQVAAEAAEAQRLGLTQAGEVSRFATAADSERIERAGRQAVTTNLAAR